MLIMSSYLSGDDSDHDDKFEDTLEDEIKSHRETECRREGTMNPELYHGTYEDDENWPRKSWGNFVRAAGHWCGGKAHELHNHDLYNYHINGEFNTGDYNDLCFAYKGKMEEMNVYMSYTRSDNDQEWRGWVRAQTAINDLQWTWRCYEIDTLLDGALAHHNLPTRKEGTNFFKIRYMRPYNRYNPPS